MIKVAFIGVSGHGGNFALREPAARENLNFVAIAPGSEGENAKALLPSLVNNGYDARVYDDYNEMLATENPDLVVVDCYYGDHAKAAIAAFNAGCHVFCEKPVATTLEDLEAVRAAWKAAGTEFTAMLNFRYEPPFNKAWHMIQEGAIGEVRLLNGQKSYKMGTRPAFTHDRATYGGTIPWVGIHAVDWLPWLSGKKFVSATASQSRIANGGNGTLETDALCLYQMEDGVLGSVTMDYLNPTGAQRWGDDRVRVVGTKGVLEVRGGKLYFTNAENDATEIECPDAGDPFYDFVKQIEGDAGRCLVPAEDAFATTEAALRAQLSADNGGIPVEF